MHIYQHFFPWFRCLLLLSLWLEGCKTKC